MDKWLEIQEWYDSGPHSLFRDVKSKFNLTRHKIDEALINGNLKIKSKSRQNKDRCIKKRNNGTLLFTDAQKQTLSLAMSAAVKRSPASYSSNSVCGRAKTYEYNGAKFKGTWELEIAKILDDSNILWEREVSPITYTFEDKQRLYFPDFWIPSLGLFIEVKGYTTAKDIAKWQCARKQWKLIVIQEEDFILLKSRIITIESVLTREAGWLSDSVS